MGVMVVVSIVSFLALRDNINFYPAERSMVATTKRLAKILESDMGERGKRRATRALLSSVMPPKEIIDAWREKGFQPFYLIDRNQTARTNIELPQTLKIFLQQDEIEKRVAVQGNIAFVGGPIVSVDGQEYRLILSNYIGRFKGRMIIHFFDSITLLQWLIYLILSSSLCFLLAYTLVRPIKALRSATQALRKGEHLSAVDAIGNRKDEFYQLAEEFDAMANTTHQTINAQKQLLSDVSHELRSPLTRIQIAIGLLEKQNIESTTKHLNQIQNDIDAMEQMIAQLLNIAALERGQVTERKVDFLLNELLLQMKKNLEYEASAKPVNFELDIELKSDKQDKEDVYFFIGYYQLLCSAIENVIRNAIRHCKQNGTVTVTLKKEAEAFLIEVDDEGDGVEPENIDKLFDPFFRTDSARARHTGGIGLGLTIASRAVKANGGSIRAENRTAENRPVDNETVSNETVSNQTGVNKTLKGLKVIIELPIR